MQLLQSGEPSGLMASVMVWPPSTTISWLMPLNPLEEPELLASTLACLSAQTRQANELVIAADGPLPDALMTVIDASGLPVRVIQQPSREGIGSTLAKVAPLCRGELIVRIDSDDLYAEEHTATVTNCLIHNPNLGVVGCQLLELDSDRHWQRSARRTPTSPEKVQRWLPWRNPLNHQTVALRRQALIDAGGYRHTPGFEDWDLWLRIVAAGYQLTNLPTCTAAARVNRRHRERRRGLTYIKQECIFYARQIQERRLNPWLATAACFSRLPWRLLPTPLLALWMQSKLRGSPSLEAAWITQLMHNPSGPKSDGDK